MSDETKPVAATPPPETKPPEPKQDAPKPPPVDILAEIRARVAPRPKPEAKTPPAGSQTPPAADPKAAPEPPKPEPKAEAKPEPKPTEPKPEEPRRRPRNYVVKDRDQQSAREVATAVAKEVVGEMVKATKPEPKPEAPQVPEMFQDHARIYEKLEKLHPDKYGSNRLVRKLAESARKIEAYQDEWQKANPGQDFDPDEHEEAIAKLSPNIPEDELMEARIELAVDAREQRRTRAEQERTRQEEQTQTEARRQQTQSEAVKSFHEEMMVAVDPELEPLLKSGDHKKIQARIQEQEVQHLIANGVLTKLQPVYERAAVIFSDTSNFDARNPVDAHILNELVPEIEARLDGIEDGEGRTYVPSDEWVKLTPREQRQHFTLSREIALHYIKAQAIKQYRAFSSKLESKASQKDDSAVQKNGHTEEQKNGEQKPAPNNSTASGVGAPGGGPALSTGAPPANPKLEQRNKFLSGLLGRKLSV